MSNNKEIIINSTELKTIVLAASKDQTRYHLNGVLFSQGYIYATDGHIASFKYDESYKSLENYHIPTDIIKAIPKNILFEAKATDSELILMHPNFRYTFRKVNAPNIKHLIPNQDKGQTKDKVFFNAKLLERVIKASYLYTSSKTPKVNLVYGTDSLSPLSVYVNDVLTGVIMPMRG